jgi:hypothetical protein
MVANARERALQYLADTTTNKIDLQVRFDRLKRAFFAPPNQDNAEREAIMKSAKNIAFLFLEAKLAETEMKLEDVIPQFDTTDKGNSSYLYISIY